MRDFGEQKEISIDGKILDLKKKHHQFINQIQRKKLILVEGTDDLYFLNYYLESQEFTGIEVRYIGCKFEFISLSSHIKTLNNFSLVESLGLVCDADDNLPEDEFQRLNKVINDINDKDPISGMNLVFPNEINIFSEGKPKIGLFIFPDNERKGRLEDLFLDCMRDKQGMKCVEPFMDCVFKLQKPPRIRSKAEALAFLATFKETRRGVGGAAREGFWDFKSDKLNKIKLFIENL